MTNTFRENFHRGIFDDFEDIYRKPSNGNPTEVVKLLTFLIIENLKILQP